MPSKIFCATILFGFAFIAWNTSPVMASPPDVTFLCNRMPEVCTNMCWAVRCANPTFPQTLNWDDPDDDTRKERRKSAGCQKGNKCNKGKSGVGNRGAGYRDCDEYPFASTSDSTYPNGHQVSRCVPRGQNGAQGNALKQAYGRFRDEGYTSHSLKINFGNPGSSGVNYCLNEACRNDGYEVQDKQLKRRDEDPSFRFYTTMSGIVLGSIDEDTLASNYTRMVDGFETLPNELESWFEEVDGEQVKMVNDMIVAEIPVETLRAVK
ncbi:hypothetical protein B0A50_08620 [Salinomyces thailandicus]|uniref:Deoxyribonuclease NucA/NucB domain-containing protein n=1 Tax=Salinomyces thailandicus TaxID=706561 RepID=A0A4U0TJB3_9PEZI|nr:hypothetical protein B0A50_08620 [Salinomyces thailandica]